MAHSLLKIVFHQAENLKAVNTDGETSDPFCVVTYDKFERRTKTCKSTVNPKWNDETVQVPIDDSINGIEKAIVIKLYDDTTGFVDAIKLKKKILIGEVVVVPKNIKCAAGAGYDTAQPEWHNVDDKGVKSGRLQLTVEWIYPHPVIAKLVANEMALKQGLSLSSSSGSGFKSSSGSGIGSSSGGSGIRQSSFQVGAGAVWDDDPKDFEDENAALICAKTIGTEFLDPLKSMASDLLLEKKDDGTVDIGKTIVKFGGRIQKLVAKATIDSDASFLREQVGKMLNNLDGVVNVTTFLGENAPFVSAAFKIIAKFKAMYDQVKANKETCKEISKQVSFLESVCTNLQHLFVSYNAPMTRSTNDVMLIVVDVRTVCNKALVAIREWTAVGEKLFGRARQMVKSSSYATRFETIKQWCVCIQTNMNTAMSSHQLTMAYQNDAQMMQMMTMLQNMRAPTWDVSTSLKTDMQSLIGDLRAQCRNDNEMTQNLLRAGFESVTAFRQETMQHFVTIHTTLTDMAQTQRIYAQHVADLKQSSDNKEALLMAAIGKSNEDLKLAMSKMHSPTALTSADVKQLIASINQSANERAARFEAERIQTQQQSSSFDSNSIVSLAERMEQLQLDNHRQMQAQQQQFQQQQLILQQQQQQLAAQQAAVAEQQRKAEEDAKRRRQQLDVERARLEADRLRAQREADEEEEEEAKRLLAVQQATAAEQARQQRHAASNRATVFWSTNATTHTYHDIDTLNRNCRSVFDARATGTVAQAIAAGKENPCGHCLPSS